MKKSEVELIVWGLEQLFKAVPKMAIDFGKLNELATLVTKLEEETK